MKILKKTVRLFSLMGIAVSQTAMAMPVGVTQTSELCRTADVIVAARCDHTVSKMRPSFLGGKADDTVYLKVERTIKNNTGKALSPNLNFWSGQCSDVSASKAGNFRGIYFLRRDKEANLFPVDEHHIAVPLSPLSDCSFASGAAPMAIVADELARTIGTEAQKFNTVTQSIGQAEDSNHVKVDLDQASNVYTLAIDAISQLPPRYAVPPLLKVLASKNERCRISALNALVQLKDFDKLAVLEPILMNPPKSLYHDVGLLSYHMNTDDPKYKPIMMRLSQSKDKRIRDAARENIKFMAENR